jgi:hypothetical protein
MVPTPNSGSTLSRRVVILNLESMHPICGSIAALAVMLSGAAFYGADPPVTGPLTEDDLLLCVAQGTPLVYFKPVAGITLVLSQIVYNDFGRPESYVYELTGASPSKLTVLVRRTSDDRARTPTFTARAGEHTLVELPAADSKGLLIAMNPGRDGGVCFAPTDGLDLNLSTDLGYDGCGRMQVAVQTFNHAGTKWKVTFSDYRRDGVGRVTSYKAILMKVD